jgi:hypothetical protein
MGGEMRAFFALACGALALAGCGTNGLADRSLTVRSPIGSIGDQAGTNVGKPSGIAPADTITLNLKQLIASQLGQSAQPTIEMQIAAFDNSNNNDATKMAGRNSILNSIVWASNANCLVYLQYLRGNQVLERALSGSLATVFSAAATAFTPTATKSALSALATISTGVGTTIDTSAFAQQTLDVLAGAIEADRDAYRSDALAKDMTRSYSDFDLAAALTDAQIYHNKCEVMEGLHYLQLQTASTSSPPKDVKPLATTPPAGADNKLSATTPATQG